MKKILSFGLAFIFGMSQVSMAGTQVPAKDVTVNTSSFSKNLNSSDDTVQAALNTLDQVQGSGGGSGNWGSIGGILSNQTDLWSALGGKQATITTGITAQYLRGDLSLATFPTNLNQFTNGPGYVTGVNWNQLGGIQSSVNISGFTNDSVFLNATTWAAISKIVQDNNINWASIQDIAGSNINWASVNEISTANINWSNFLLPNVNINWIGGLIPNSAINWPGLTILNGTGVNWQNFYPTSNPFSFLTTVPWGSGTTGNMTGINWQNFYPTSNPFSFLSTVPWNLGTTGNLTGINWSQFYPTSNPFSFLTSVPWSQGTTTNMTGINWPNFGLLTGNQTFSGNNTFTNTITGNISGNAATATNVPYTGLTGTVPTWNQNTSGNAATVTTNANLSGPITSVGNATSVGSQTGSGNKFVMDTSPTINSPSLVTPNLGIATGTSLNLTNLLSSNPVVTDSSNKLISGSFSGNTTKVVTANGSYTPGDCIKSDVYGNHIDAGGPCGITGPGGSDKQVQVNSSGSFAGYSNFIFDGNNLGIGTPSPGQALDVSGTIRATQFLGIVSTPAQTSITSLGTLTGLTVNGNIGVGTLTATYNIGVGTYSVCTTAGNCPGGGGGTPGGSSPQIQYNNGGSFNGISNTGSDGTNIGIGTPIPKSSLTIQKNSFTDYFRVDSTSQAKGNIFLISNSGNVGISTINPQNTLSIGGTESIGTAYATIGAPTNGLLVQGNIGVGSPNPQSQLDVAGIIHSLGEIINGNVGIGSTNPGQNLDVPGTIRTGNLITGTGSASITGDSNGNVGINQASPGQRLDVNGTIKMVGLQLSTNPSPGYILTSSSIGMGTWMPAPASGGTPGGSTPQLQWNNGGVFGGVSGSGVDSNGNIGIGSTNPGQTLDVQGTVRITSGGTVSALFPNNVGIGTTLSTNLLDVAGGGAFGATYAGHQTAPSNGLTIQGNVGIGTWVVGQGLLQVGTASSAGTIVCFGTNNCLGTCASGASCLTTCTCTCTCKTS